MKGTLAFQVTKYVPMILIMLSNSAIAIKGQLRVKVGRRRGILLRALKFYSLLKGKKELLHHVQYVKLNSKENMSLQNTFLEFMKREDLICVQFVAKVKFQPTY